jgi:ribose 5-phosphate isomerase B
MKKQLAKLLECAGYEVIDFGPAVFDPDDDYPDFAIPLAQAVASGDIERGILVCCSGVGPSVAANKVNGVRAALCHDGYSARQGVEDVDMNILCLGGQTTGIAIAWDCTTNFLSARFSDATRHRRRLEKVKQLEEACL